jgi:hypothetical protein
MISYRHVTITDHMHSRKLSSAETEIEPRLAQPGEFTSYNLGASRTFQREAVVGSGKNSAQEPIDADSGEGQCFLTRFRLLLNFPRVQRVIPLGAYGVKFYLESFEIFTFHFLSFLINASVQEGLHFQSSSRARAPNVP